jgi:hypothetical protein
MEARIPESMDKEHIRTISLVTGGTILGLVLFIRILKML